MAFLLELNVGAWRQQFILKSPLTTSKLLTKNGSNDAKHKQKKAAVEQKQLKAKTVLKRKINQYVLWLTTHSSPDEDFYYKI